MKMQATGLSEDLPIWMVQARRGLDWGMIITLIVALMLSIQFWTGADIQLLNDNENHAFMISDIAQSIREGQVYPRWSAHVERGYGAPITNYYSVGVSYLGALIEIFLTNDSLIALRVLYTVFFLIAGSALYAFTTIWMGTKSGLIASLLFLTSPYFSVTAPHILGNLHSVAGYAIFIALMWAISRQITVRGKLDFALISLLTTALILTDLRIVLSALIIVPLFLIWHRYFKREKVLLRVIIPIIIGIGMSAFFWIPAIIERDAVIWIQNSVHPPQRILEFEDLFAPIKILNPQSLNQVPIITLGYGMLICIVGGVISAILNIRTHTLALLMFGTGATLIRIATITLPAEINILGIIIFCMAIGASAIIDLEKQMPQYFQKWFLPALISVILLSTLPLLYQPETDDFPFEFTVQDQITYQNEGFGIPLLPAQWSLPSAFIGQSSASRQAILDNTPTNTRIVTGQLSGDAQITLVSRNNHSAIYQIDTAQPIAITYQTAYFPGWQATLNTVPIATRAHPQNGLIQIDIPAVRNATLEIYLASTSARDIAWFVSGLMFLIVVIITRRRLQLQNTQPMRLFTFIPMPAIYRMLPIIGIFVILSIWPELTTSVLIRQPNNTFTQIISSDGNKRINLIGYDIPAVELQTHDVLEIDLFWRFDQTPTPNVLASNVLVQLHLQNTTDPDQVLSSAIRHPGGIPVKRWSADHYITDNYQIPLPSNISTGMYTITIDLIPCESMCRGLPDQNDSQMDSIVLPATITITP